VFGDNPMLAHQTGYPVSATSVTGLHSTPHRFEDCHKF
jgi:hypothetical protein